MSLSMYQASAPVFIRMLTNLRAIVEKAVAHAGIKGIDPAVLVNSRLYPDMLPLSRQVQIAADMAKNSLSRLAGLEPPKFEDTESTFAELLARIDRTIAHVKTFKPEQIDGTEGKDITLQMRTGPMEFKGQAYLIHFVLPNFYFHLAIAYGLLRSNGLELGKMDFIGA